MAAYEKEMGYADDEALYPESCEGRPYPKVILLTHDESTFYANDQQKRRWYAKDEKAVPEPKGEGSSIMVSDFCTPQGGFLQLSDG